VPRAGTSLLALITRSEVLPQLNSELQTKMMADVDELHRHTFQWSRSLHCRTSASHSGGVCGPCERNWLDQRYSLRQQGAATADA
jgi:hypothetical protein